MMTTTMRECHAKLQLLGLDAELILQRTKALLAIYMDVKWAVQEHTEELYSYAADVGWQSEDTGLAFLSVFAPDIDTVAFEARVCRVEENKLMITIVDKAVARLRRYPQHGPVYHEILAKCYLSGDRLKEDALVSILNMDRTTFYRRKKEAVLLLGLSLFGLAAPQPRVYEPAEQLSLFEVG